MANGKNRLFWLTSLAISSIPLAVTFFGVYSDRNWLTILSFTVFIICLLLSTCTFLSWKTFKFSTPIILQILRAISVALTPLANILRGIPVLGKVFNGIIKLVFWTWFVILMFSDVLVRKLLKAFVGIHEPSAGQYSTVNACDTNFQPCGEFGRVLDKEKVKRIEEGGHNFEKDHDYDERKVAVKPSQGHGNTTCRRSTVRPKSMGDLGKYRMPGKRGSDLTSMTGADWAKVLEMANIDQSRYYPGSVSVNDDEDDHGVNLRADRPKVKPAADRPRYSQPIATTLAMVSKLVYEDVPIIRHELAHSGYDMHSFRAIAYKNTCGFIVQKGRNIILVFRGTDPLNLQNAWTDIQSRLQPIETLQDPPVPLGRCHQGMYNALGSAGDFLLPSEELARQQRDLSQRHARMTSYDSDGHGDRLRLEDAFPALRSNTSPASTFRSEVSKSSTLNLELSNQSVYQTIVTSIRAAYILIKFLIVGLFTHVADPVDYRFAGEIRDLGAFAQACRWVDGLRLEHAEKEYKRLCRAKGSAKNSNYRTGASGPGSRLVTRSNSLGSLYSQDEMDYLEDIDNYKDDRSAGSRRRPSLSNQGSFRGTTRRLSITGIHPVGSGHHRRRLSGQTSDSKDTFLSFGSMRDLGNNILDIYNNQHRTEQDGFKKKKLRFYVCGHSLGGGLATIFLAKMVQSNSPLLDIFSGLYTYGCPRIGDKDFSHAFGPKLACKMFHHVHNNDMFARLPFWGGYETPPGTLVFMDTSRKLTLYPPDPQTLMPVPVRGISFMHLSGMLNVRVIMRMRRESWLRILERIVLPFFLNDHFPGDYVKALAEGKIEVVVQDSAHYGGVDETETGSPVQTGYFSFLTRGRKKSAPTTTLATPAAAAVGSKERNSGDHGPRRSENLKGLNITLDQPSGDNDSGYGAGSRSDQPASLGDFRARRRIVKYTYRQEDEDEDGDFNGDDRHYAIQDIRRNQDGEGEVRWKELASEPRSNRPPLRRSRSSSLSRSGRSSGIRMQRVARRGGIGFQQRSGGDP